MGDESNFVRAIVFGNMVSGYAMRMSPQQLQQQGYFWAAQHAQVAASWYEHLFAQQAELPPQRHVPRASRGGRPTSEELRAEAEANAEVERQATEVEDDDGEPEGDPVLAKFRREMAAQGKRVADSSE